MAPLLASASPNTQRLFSVRRRDPELVVPAAPTPRELKPLSDIDDQRSLRFQVRVFLVYRANPSATAAGRDPASVTRDALAKALVFYYPLAGRLREGLDGKLMVDCTGEGVLFIEADADVRLEQFGDQLRLPFEQLLCDPPGSSGIIGCPVLFIQVTRLLCGGFVLGIRTNHTMSDAQGILQHLNAMADVARGAPYPTGLPIWRREILAARSNPRVTRIHHEYDKPAAADCTPSAPGDQLVLRSFFFRPRDIAALRLLLPPHLRSSSSTFDVLTAYLWRSRTAALGLRPGELVRLMPVVNARAKVPFLIPAGYYGNGFTFPAAVSTAGELCHNSLAYAVHLIKMAKADMTEEYAQSVADLMVLRGRPHFTEAAGTWFVSDLTRLKFRQVDLGWGDAVYGGTVETIGGLGSFYVAYNDGIVVPLRLPAAAMQRFAEEIGKMTSSRPLESEIDEAYPYNDTSSALALPKL
ncbi:hypothetical protein Taro_041899 [Colocasia esculenta]|uniref:Benzyl alcohol O-benzoyltransferase n=1 Tax=Colocasia esculenta TaxID=4460 RepID=A0A843WR82_COLES|nr:hypothetical protein [Colocasia esculenta]